MNAIEKIWITDTAVWIRTADGKEANECFSDYARLRTATPAQRANFEVDSFGIHWPDVDEDLSFEGFFEEKNYTPLYKFFMAHPELNASAVARRMGIQQSLLAAYISGQKKPSPERMQSILDTVHSIGEEIRYAKLETA